MIEQSGYRFTDVENGYVDADLAEVFMQKKAFTQNLLALGSNNYGQLGDGTITASTSFKEIKTSFKTSSLVDIYGYEAAVFDSTGHLYAWGANESGSLGLNNVTRYSRPVLISQDNWKSIILTGHFAGIKEDGTLWTCGDNISGQLGLNHNVKRSTLTQVGVKTDWVKVRGNSNSTHLLDESGNYFHMGLDIQTGGGQIYRSTPVQLGNIGAYRDILAVESFTSSFLLDHDGNLHAHGGSAYGILGLNSTANIVNVQSVPTDLKITAVRLINNSLAANTCAIFITEDGDLAYTGNSYIHTGGTNYRSTLTLLPGVGKWKDIVINSGVCTGIDLEGNVWQWGNNSSGDHPTINRSIYDPLRIDLNGRKAISIETNSSSVYLLVE